jgi:hypothetical protein
MFNWWNDPTGPSGFGPGLGEQVLWCPGQGPVYFSPWLYVEHCIANKDQTGYFAFCIEICKGLNAISTPVTLSDGEGAMYYDEGSGMLLKRIVPQSDNWSEIKANSGITSGDIKYALKWNATMQRWDCVENCDVFTPLQAWYVYFRDCAPGCLILYTNSGAYTQPQVPVKKGWNLIGPNPLFWDIICGYRMPVSHVLATVKQLPDGRPGYAQVVSPVLPCQYSWYYVPGCCEEGQLLEVGKGYWVYMLNDSTLVGVGFTPVPNLHWCTGIGLDP